MGNIILCALILVLTVTVICLRLYITEQKKYNRKAYILVPCSEKTTDLEKTIRAYYWEEFFENREFSRDIIIVLMDNSSNNFEARRLANDFSIVHAVDISELADYLKRENSSKCYEKSEM